MNLGSEGILVEDGRGEGIGGWEGIGGLRGKRRSPWRGGEIGSTTLVLRDWEAIERADAEKCIEAEDLDNRYWKAGSSII